jgi:hypothetical protein
MQEGVRSTDLPWKGKLRKGKLTAVATSTSVTSPYSGDQFPHFERNFFFFLSFSSPEGRIAAVVAAVGVAAGCVRGAHQAPAVE